MDVLAAQEAVRGNVTCETKNGNLRAPVWLTIAPAVLPISSEDAG